MNAQGPALTLARQPCSECEQPTGHLCAYCSRAVCWGCWSAGHDCQIAKGEDVNAGDAEAVLARQLRAELAGQQAQIDAMSDRLRKRLLAYVWARLPAEERAAALTAVTS